MTTIVLKISDGAGQIDVEGHCDQDAMNGPPTPALIIGTYLAANMEQVCKDAVQWARGTTAEPSRIVLSDGAPV